MTWVQFFDLLYEALTRKEKDALRNIRREYEKVARDTTSELGAIFSRLADGKLSMQDVRTVRRLQRLEQRLTASALRLGKYNRTVISKLLDESYELSYGMLAYALDMAVERTLEGKSPSLPQLLALNDENGIEKLRLNQSLEKSRDKVTKGIQQAIQQGLTDGATFQQTASSVQRVFEMDYNRAVTITETEVHRIREKGTNDKAQDALRQGIVMKKRWNNVGDERVRRSNKANHRTLQGQERGLKEPFDLGFGITAQYPGSSGTPQNDIRCRCFASYEVEGIRELSIADNQQALLRDYEAWKAE
ncbi:phage minor head protein [Exiguobacterium sp. S3]|uniref:phage minor head protein n=1 Tax=Exiguobacterium sp. S3 TaxID=483245 RepID=UPI001BE74062|nr:phage minor head protein [Exiguobacterium sp. S3]